MISISRASKKETKSFNEKEWHGVDIEHYGQRVDWHERKFRFQATQDGRLLGDISGKHESGVLYIGQIIVAADQRGKGIGEMLMNAAEDFGRRMGAHKAWLITGKTWKANAFYRKLGYAKTADLPRHHFQQDFVIYSKFL